MKTYLLKCEKWYNSTMAIFSEGRKVGNFFPGFYSSAYKVMIGENEFIIKKKSFFNCDLSVFSKNGLLASVKNFTFRNYSIITTANKVEYFLKSNTWNSKYVLSGQDGFSGECHQKMTSSVYSFDERVDDSVVAATIAQTHMIYETAIYVAIFVPIFVIMISR
jgi:hypothetical protein